MFKFIREQFAKVLGFLALILFVACAVDPFVDRCMALTAQEAENIYRDNLCRMVSQESDQICYICDKTPLPPDCPNPANIDVTVHWTPAWEQPVVDPGPIPEPSCVPTWCGAPLILCTETPIKGVDSCGNECTKPSQAWPNCKNPDGSIGQIQ